MWTRVRWIAWPAAAVVLAVAVTGCGKTRDAVAPQATDVAPPGSGPDPAERDEAVMAARALPISGPTTISSPGDYRLKKDFEVAQGDGILITASHVRLWLGEHRLTGPGNKVGRGIVIDGAEDVQVAGGHIERFGMGAVLLGASRCRLHDLDVRGGDETANPASGNPPQVGIMLINSGLNALTGNELKGVNLGIFVRGGDSHGNRIAENEVVGGEHGLLAICYNPAPGGDPAGPHNDQVSRNRLDRFGTGISASAQSTENAFTRNRIRYFTSAWVDRNGTNLFVNNRTEQIVP